MIYTKLLKFLPHILISLFVIFVIYFIYRTGVKHTEYNIWKDAKNYIDKQDEKLREVKEKNKKIKDKIFDNLPEASDDYKSCILSNDPIHHKCNLNK